MTPTPNTTIYAPQEQVIVHPGAIPVEKPRTDLDAILNAVEMVLDTYHGGERAVLAPEPGKPGSAAGMATAVRYLSQTYARVRRNQVGK